MEGQKVSVDVSRVIPIFADEVLVASRIKALKDDKKLEKEGNVELIFLDQLSHPPKAISRVVVNRATAKSLVKVLGENIQKLEKDIKDKSLPKPNIPHAVPKQDKGYLG